MTYYSLRQFDCHEAEHVADAQMSGLGADDLPLNVAGPPAPGSPTDLRLTAARQSADAAVAQSVGQSSVAFASALTSLFAKKPKKPKAPKQPMYIQQPQSHAGTYAVVGLGALALGIGAYLIFRKKR